MEPKITLEKKPDSLVLISVVVPAAEFRRYQNRAAKKFGERYKLKGFRKGKAPSNVVKGFVGDADLNNEAAQLAVDGLYNEVVEKEQLRVAGLPKIEIKKLADGNDFEFTVLLPVISELKLPDYTSITITKKPVEVTDEEITQTLKEIRRSRATAKAVARPAQKGDFVEIDFETRVGGVKIEDGESQNHPFILGEGRFLEGFEDNLVGMKAGEQKEFSLTAPTDYFHPAIAGKKVDFKVKTNKISLLDEPAWDDAFAASLGSFKNIEELKKSIKDGVIQEKNHTENDRAMTELINAISEKSTVVFPSELTNKETDAMVHDLKHRVLETGLDWANYLEQIKKSEEEFKKDWQPKANQRIKTALIIEALVEREGVKATAEEITQRANEYLRRFKSAKAAERNINLKALAQKIAQDIEREKLFEKLQKNLV